MIISISGVRGVYGEDLVAEKLVRLGARFGEFTKGGPVVVGRDTRTTGDLASKAAIAGLLSVGCAVTNLGFASTPAIFKEVARNGFSGGLSITASHNPPEWNGVKFIVEGGMGPSSKELHAITRNLNRPFSERPQKSGTLVHARSSYAESIEEYLEGTSLRNISVSLDLGGGVGVLTFPGSFRSLGARVHTINSVPGVFSRTIDPTVDDLKGLSNLVKRTSSDIGFAFDCDGDRVVVVDAKGKKLSADHTLLLNLKDYFRSSNKGKCVVSVDTSQAVEEVGYKFGWRVTRCKVGEANVVKTMLEVGAKIGGEGSSGGVIHGDFAWCRDGLLSALIICRMLKERSLSSLVASLPRSYLKRGAVPLDTKKSIKVMKRLVKEEGGADLADGVKIFPSSKSWVLMRPSATEASLRVSVESDNEHEAARLFRAYYQRIREMAKKTV